jgi:hypothetical protein
MSHRPVLLPSLRTLALAAAVGALAACGGEAPDSGGARLSGLLIDPQLDEISGLAASRRHRGVLWVHDDGGNPERLFAVDLRGQRLATFRLEDVPKTDWEDIAAFELDGRAYLLVADVGDQQVGAAVQLERRDVLPVGLRHVLEAERRQALAAQIDREQSLGIAAVVMHPQDAAVPT